MKWPIRALAITGIVTASWMPAIISGSDMRATPPSLRMSAGTRSSAMTAAAPASSAILASSAVTTSMITPPLSISARPDLTRKVPVSLTGTIVPAAARVLVAVRRAAVGRGAADDRNEAPVVGAVVQRQLADAERGRVAELAGRQRIDDVVVAP